MDEIKIPFDVANAPGGKPGARNKDQIRVIGCDHSNAKKIYSKEEKP